MTQNETDEKLNKPLSKSALDDLLCVEGPYKTHMVGFTVCKFTGSTEHIQAKNIDKRGPHATFEKFNYCPYCGAKNA